jgi:Acetyltransferase (GNAT) domain
VSKAPVEVRAATEKDYPDIAALLDRIFGPRPYEQRVQMWRWRHAENPSRIASIPSFLLAAQGGQVVAVHGLLPLKLKVGDTELIASCSCDLAADPSTRGAGMKIKLRAMSRDLAPLHISTSANEPANRLTLALGGQEVPGGRRKLLKLLRLEKLLPQLLRPRLGGAIGGLVGALAGYSSTLALSLHRAVTRGGGVAGARIETIDRFDDRFTELGKPLIEPHAVAVIRDREYLEWRYRAYPFPGIESFALLRGEVLLGYAVIHVATDPDGHRFAALLELAVPRGDAGAFAQLLREAVQRAARRGAHYVIARAPAPEWEPAMTARGFLLRLAPTSPATYKNNTMLPDDRFAAGDSWYLSLGDGDGCFYVR